MFKYIGIRGHRGSGKQTIGFLLGVGIEYYFKHRSWEGFDEVYERKCKEIVEDEDCWKKEEMNRVILDRFGDQVKYTLSGIFNIDKECMDDDHLKDEMYINLKDFSTWVGRDKIETEEWKKEKKIYTASSLMEKMWDRAKESFLHNTPNIINEDLWINLRNLVTYFGKYLMQGFMGKNVWTKSYNVNERMMDRFYAGDKIIYKILMDCKFPCEITYIKEIGGKIVNVVREDNRKEDSEVSLELQGDDRWDVEIKIINSDLLSIRERIKEIVEFLMKD